MRGCQRTAAQLQPFGGQNDGQEHDNGRIRSGRYNDWVQSDSDLLFEVLTPLGFSVRVTRARWEFLISVKHPAMAGREDVVQSTLQSPEQVRQSRSDSDVMLFYRAERSDRWVCAVARQTADSGFLITAYPTDAIKEGTQVWPK